MTVELSASEVAELAREVAVLSAEIAKIESTAEKSFGRIGDAIGDAAIKIEEVADSLESVVVKLESIGRGVGMALSASTAEADGLGSGIRKVGDIGSTVLGMLPNGAAWAAGLQLATEAAGALADAISRIPRPEEQMAAIKEYRNALNAASSDASAMNETMAAATRERLEDQESSLKLAILLANMGRGFAAGAGEGFVLPDPTVMSQAQAEIEAYQQQLNRVQLALAGVVPPAVDLNNIHVDLTSSIARNAQMMDAYTEQVKEQALATVNLATFEQLRAEAGTAANASLKQSLDDLVRTETERQDRQRQAAADYISDIEEEIEVLSLRAAGQTDAADKLKLEQDLVEKLGAAYGMNAEQIAALIEKRKTLNAEIERQKKAEEEAKAAAKKAADELQAIWDKAGNDLFKVWQDGWRDVLSGNLKDFDDFAKKIGQIGLNLVAELMAQQSRDWLKGLLFGGNTSGVVGNNPLANPFFSGGINDVGVRLGFSNPDFAAYGGTSGAWTSASLGQVLGAGAIGYMGGSFFGNLVGMRNPGNAGLGAGAGAMLGMTFGGPWGALAGAAIGSAAGLLGPRPSDRTEGVNFNWDTGARDWRNLGPNKRDPQNEALARSIDASITAFRQTLIAAGLNPQAHGGLIEVGAGNSLAPFRVSVDASGVQSFQTQEEAFAFLADSLLNSLGEVPEELQGIVDNFDPTNVEAFIRALEAPGLLKQFMEPITDQLDQALNPRQFELDKLAEQFARLRTEAQALGATTEELDSIQQLEGIQREHINARHDAPFNDMMKTVRDDIARNADPRQWELDQLDAHYEQMRDLAEGHNEELAEIDIWYGQQRAQITEKYAAEALAKAEQAAAEQAARVQSAMDRVMEQARATISVRLEALAEERRIIEENAGKYRGILASIKSAQARFTSDPRISPTSNQQRLADLMAQLNAAYAKAQNGDEEAAAEIADLAMAAAEANVAYNASSEEAARIQSQIATILGNTRNLASRELQIAQLNLDANDAQVDLLEQLLDKMGQPDQKTPATMNDLNALMTAFAQANTKYNFSGMTAEQVSSNPIWRSFEDDLFDTVSRLEKSDAAIKWLQDSLAWAPNEIGTNFEFAARRRVPKLMQRLVDFGITPIRPQGFTAGGRTGNVAIVHPNEMIYTGPPAMVYNARETASMMTGGNVLRELQGIRADIGVLSRTVSITGEDQVVQLSRHDMRLAAIESNFTLARARA